MQKAHWNLLQNKLNLKTYLSDFDGYSVDQLEQAPPNWTKTVKNTMDTAIPKTIYKYIFMN